MNLHVYFYVSIPFSFPSPIAIITITPDNEVMSDTVQRKKIIPQLRKHKIAPLW